MDSYLENAMDYVQEAFESANQWMKENDPLRFPEVEASVWDALDNDREVGRDRNEGRDYVRTSIAGTMDSDYKKGAYSRDPGEDRNPDRDYGSDRGERSNELKDRVAEAERQVFGRSIDDEATKAVLRFLGDQGYTAQELQEKAQNLRIAKAISEVWGKARQEEEAAEKAKQEEAKVEKEANLKKADDELKELKEKHLKILEETSKSSDANAEAMGKAVQDVAEKTAIVGAGAVGARAGAMVGGALGGPVGGGLGFAVGGYVGEKLGEHSVEKTKEIVNEHEKTKDEL